MRGFSPLTNDRRIVVLKCRGETLVAPGAALIDGNKRCSQYPCTVGKDVAGGKSTLALLAPCNSNVGPVIDGNSSVKLKRGLKGPVKTGKCRGLTWKLPAVGDTEDQAQGQQHAASHDVVTHWAVCVVCHLRVRRVSTLWFMVRGTHPVHPQAFLHAALSTRGLFFALSLSTAAAGIKAQPHPAATRARA